MLEFARCLATGFRPFDSPLFWVPERAKVLLIEQELGEHELHKRTSTTFARHKPTQYADNIYYLSQVPEMQINEPNGLQYLVDAIDHVKPNVVFLDPISMFHGFDENSNTEIGLLFQRLAKIRAGYANEELSFVISHHFKKPGMGQYKADPLDAYNFSGSQRWYNTPDTRVTFNRYKDLPDSSGWYVNSRWIPRRGKKLDDIKFLITPTDEHCQIRVVSGETDVETGEKAKLLPDIKKTTGFILDKKKEQAL